MRTYSGEIARTIRSTAAAMRPGRTGAEVYLTDCGCKVWGRKSGRGYAFEIQHGYGCKTSPSVEPVRVRTT